MFDGRNGNSNYFNEKISVGNFFPDVHLFPSITGKLTRSQIISVLNRFKSKVDFIGGKISEIKLKMLESN